MLAVIAVLRFSNKYCPQLYTDNMIIAEYNKLTKLAC
jgi:hypothetical protein